MKETNINKMGIIYQNLTIFFLIRIIQKRRKILNYKNWTSLHYAAIHNSKEIAELLISKGANLNAQDFVLS